jgi:hypothetical protein
MTAGGASSRDRRERSRLEELRERTGGRNENAAAEQNKVVDEGNVAAGDALKSALGIARPKPRNWTVCHVWGYDDPDFKSEGAVVRDPPYFSCVANMVWLATPLKGFTDALPEIKSMLRTCVFHLYGWVCEHQSVIPEADAIRSGLVPEGYPTTWPSPARPDLLPPGTAAFTPAVIQNIRRQKSLIRSRLADASLTHFPRDEVREVLAFWKIDLSSADPL